MGSGVGGAGSGVGVGAGGCGAGSGVGGFGAGGDGGGAGDGNGASPCVISMVVSSSRSPLASMPGSIPLATRSAETNDVNGGT